LVLGSISISWGKNGGTDKNIWRNSALYHCFPLVSYINLIQKIMSTVVLLCWSPY
jgi:hypothetical protein